jgi:sugar-specific transcriptional regulator TrmB
MIIHEALGKLDFTDREIDIYLAVLKLGPASIRDIASQSDINRGTTYELLKGLHKRGLVSYFPRGKRRFFCAEPPEQLLQIAEEKRQHLGQAIDTLQSDIIPDLNLLKPDRAATNVHYYEGDEGIEHVLRDILRTVEQSQRKIYSVYSSKLIRKYLYRPFPNYTRQRVQRNIRVQVIAIGEGGEDAPLAERKWIDIDDRDTAASYVAIYPPKCAMISLIQEDYPTAVVIDSSAIALALKISFDTLWNLL